MSDPPCADECIASLRAQLEIVCRSVGIPVPESHITHVPPLIPTLYEPFEMRCPHGVLWHMQPTSEQMFQWAKDGVE